MVLLHLLASRGEYELIPVYVDHGWRDTSADWAVVEKAAKNLGIEPVRVELNLKSSSEEEARIQRYKALREQEGQFEAAGIITGHHHDDIIETVIMNVIRGTGRHGLTPFSDSSIIRPLIQVKRSEIEKYAKAHKVQWVDDPTNEDTNYLRNRVRKIIIPKMSEQSFANIEKQIKEAEKLNSEIDQWLAHFIESGKHDKESISLPLKEIKKQTPEIIQEIVVYTSRKLNPAAEFNRRAVKQLAIDLKNDRIKMPRALSRQLFVSVSHGTFTIAFKAH